MRGILILSPSFISVTNFNCYSVVCNMTVYMQVYIVYIDYGDGLAKSEDLESMGICVFYVLDKEYRIIKLDLAATFFKYSLEEKIDQLVVNLGLLGVPRTMIFQSSSKLTAVLQPDTRTKQRGDYTG